MKKLPLLVAAMLAVGTAHAQTGTFTFVGRVVETTCVVEPVSGMSGAGTDFTVALPPIERGRLAAPRQRGPAQAFVLQVGSRDAPCRQEQVSARLVSAGDTTAGGRLHNRGTATGVELVLLDAQGRDIDLNAPNLQVAQLDRGGVAQLGWKVAYQATGPASTGSVYSRLQYLLDYP
ncbi:fimbrial protein [Stenotrophomonas sp. C3(2023)]|uniref:fimbrial protein n=1 Tax=Stenotrophomonas sp. C3(2023) TaxID=3080277 RepID=UPI00293C650E|nr:fimbrial protein [Stenotrophomonas sp. C3(2023)]MDV3469786.1 fimbrial protein [Stenotrophomonas sp. C3(2023)]